MMTIINNAGKYIDHMAEEMCLTLKIDPSLKSKVEYRLNMIYKQAFEDCKQQMIQSMYKVKPQKKGVE